jgi:hypothetical protein
MSDSSSGDDRRELRFQYKLVIFACRRCTDKGSTFKKKKRKKKRKRKGTARELQEGCAREQERLPGDPLADANFAARMTTALRIMVVDTFAFDPDSCFFNMVDSDAAVQFAR